MPPKTAIKPTAAAGGCRQRSINIPKIDTAAAIGSASKGLEIRIAQLTPTKAERVLPAITAQGWAIGLPGRTKTSKALAPSDAISHSSIPLSSLRYIAIVMTNIRPIKAPIAERKRSLQATGG